MKVIELNKRPPSLPRLLEAVQSEDILLTRNGHAIARLEKFTDEDWEDWLFEHDPKVIRQAQAASERLKRGEGKTLDEVAKALNIMLPRHEKGKSNVRKKGQTDRSR